MNARRIRICAILTALIFVFQVMPVSAQTTTQITEGTQTGTQTVTTSTDTNGNTVNDHHQRPERAVKRREPR